VNAKGACIGPMGSRVRNVMTELHGEKIDIVDFSPDPAEFVAHALSPARVSRVIVVDAQARVAQVIVPDYQLSLAIGKEGQNVRLAARLTGWRIDIRPDSPGADATIASAAPEDAGGAGGPGASEGAAGGHGPAGGEPAGSGQDVAGGNKSTAGGADSGAVRTGGALASAVSDVPGSAGSMPGAPGT
jgi:transcription termination/antitermination protein NusA